MEDQQTRSEARLAEAQRVAHVGSWEWDVGSNVVTWTDEMYRIYGIEPQEFDHTYEGFLRRVLPEDRDGTQNVVLEAYRARKPFVYDHRIVRPDGSVRMLHTRGDVIADDAGQALRLTGACWDVTELWQAARERERSISLLRATLESTADALLVVDQSGHVVAHNQRLLDLWKLPARSLEGSDFHALLASVHDQLVNGDACAQLARDLAANPGAETFDRLHFRDGHCFERYSRPQRLGDQIVGRVWSYRDVTERECLMRRAVFLADASRLLASLDAEAALDAVSKLAATFMDGVCTVDLSPSATRYAVGSSSRMIVPLTAHGQALGAITFVSSGDRKYDQADLVLVGELAHRIELALENAQLYRGAKEALGARDEFLAVAAHEIRGPITSLHLAVQSLAKAPPELTARLTAIIEREDHRLARLVEQLLDITQLRSGKLRFVYEPVDLAEVTRDVVDQLAGDLSRSRSTLSITAPGTLIGSWDRTRLEQVVSNLLSNAIRFGMGKPIELRLTRDGNQATLVISDHGIGIAPQEQERIFKPFERAVPPRQYGGLGLGLYVVRTILDAMGGSVHVDSQPGAGASFTVDIPLARTG